MVWQEASAIVPAWRFRAAGGGAEGGEQNPPAGASQPPAGRRVEQSDANQHSAATEDGKKADKILEKLSLSLQPSVSRPCPGPSPGS
jgi:hypothetical protein